MSDTNPYLDIESTDTECCDLGSCGEPWAWETDRRNGPRKLRLCERHATRWQTAEQDLLAERLLLERADDRTAAKVHALALPIAAELGVTLERMLGTERTPRVAQARHRLFCALWKADFSISEIGRLLGKDHTTVLAGLRKTMGAADYKAAQLARRRPS